MSPWELPLQAEFGGTTYKLHPDYRDILEIFSYFEDPDLSDYEKWQIALTLFYDRPVPREYWQEAMAYLSDFLRGGRQHTDAPAPKLLDWEQDGAIIVAEVNKVAGKEIRSLSFVHWWTFLAWFHSIGEGQLSTLVSIREKLRKGKKLEQHEKDFYRANKATVDLKVRYSRQELNDRQALEKLLA